MPRAIVVIAAVFVPGSRRPLWAIGLIGLLGTRPGRRRGVAVVTRLSGRPHRGATEDNGGGENHGPSRRHKSVS
jgi:hypothetical protein